MFSFVSCVSYVSSAGWTEHRRKASALLLSSEPSAPWNKRGPSHFSSSHPQDMRGLKSFQLPCTLGTGSSKTTGISESLDCVPRTRTGTLTTLAMSQATTDRVEQAYKQTGNSIMEACMYVPRLWRGLLAEKKKKRGKTMASRFSRSIFPRLLLVWIVDNRTQPLLLHRYQLGSK